MSSVEETIQNTKFSCSYCKKEYSTKKLLKIHTDTQHLNKGDSYLKECPTCKKKFKQLRAHIRREHEKKHKVSEFKNVCPICNKKFVDDYKVRRHITQVHNNQRDFQCRLCEKAFFEKKDLHRHIEGVHLFNPTSRRQSSVTAVSKSIQRSSSQIVRKKLPVEKSEEESNDEHRIVRLGGGTYGPTGVYFTADSNAQSILTQPPEVLVADEGEPDDLGHIHNIDEDSSDHTLNSKANDNVMEEVISDDEDNIEFDSDKETDILKTPMVQAEDLSINVENSDSDEDLIETVTTILYDNQDENEQSHNKYALNEPENVKANQFEDSELSGTQNHPTPSDNSPIVDSTEIEHHDVTTNIIVTEDGEILDNSDLDTEDNNTAIPEEAVVEENETVSDRDDTRYKVSSTRQDISGDLILELEEKRKTEKSSNMVKIRWGVPFVERIIPNQDEINSFGDNTLVSNRVDNIEISANEDKSSNLLTENLQTEVIPEDENPSEIETCDIDTKQVAIDFKEPFREDVKAIKPSSSNTNLKSVGATNVSQIKTDKSEHIIPDPIKMEDSWKCPEQNCSFFVLEKQRGKYRKHFERIHLNLRPFSCQNCGFRFYEKYDLQRHIESVHSKVKIICPFEGCNTLTTRLDIHISKIHPEEESTFTKNNKEPSGHACDICQQVFNREYDVTRHKNAVHFGKKSFQCSECKRGFTDRRDLARHEQAIHQDRKQINKVFSCKHCKTTYKRKKDLVQHLISNPHQDVALSS